MDPDPPQSLHVTRVDPPQFVQAVCPSLSYPAYCMHRGQRSVGLQSWGILPVAPHLSQFLVTISVSFRIENQHMQSKLSSTVKALGTQIVSEFSILFIKSLLPIAIHLQQCFGLPLHLRNHRIGRIVGRCW